MRACTLIAVLSAGGLAATCAPAPKPRPVPSARQRAEGVGQRAVSQLRGALRRRVFAAMKKGGAPAAIDACATDAQRISHRINRELGGQVTIKRTSLRVRNPANAPDPAEQRVLKRMAALHARGALPAQVLDTEQRPTGTHYRFYVPIRVASLCTKCHGPAAKLNPKISAVLQKRYPKDRAVGYSAGDLRGMFSVTIPASALR